MKYELILVQIVIGIVIGLALIKLFQTKKSISYEKRLGKYAINSKKDNELSLFDQIHLFSYGLIKSISKFLIRFRSLNKKAKRYDKYIPYEKKQDYEVIDFYSIKYIILIISLIISTIYSLIKYNNFNYIIILSIFSYYILDIIIRLDFKRRRNLIEEDFLKSIMIMNNAFKSDKNIIQAITIVTEELTGPIQDEYKKLLLDVKYGLSFDAAFKRFYKRIQLEEAGYVTTGLILLNRTGGSISDLFNNIEENILTKKKMKEEYKSITSASNLMYKILIVIPILTSMIIIIMSPSYFKPFIESPIGVFSLLFIIILYISYIIIIRKIMQVSRWKVMH